MLILMDLDGPLLQIAPRYHWLHAEIVRRRGGAPLAAVDYWRWKREGIAEAELFARAGLVGRAIGGAEAERRRRIESREALRHDAIWPWAPAILAELGRRAPVVLVTHRRKPRLLAEQLRREGLRPLLAAVISGAGDGAPDVKARMVRAAGLDPAPASVFVGDTEWDIVSGKALGVRTVGLRCGYRLEPHLRAAAPDAVLDDLRDVPTWLG